MDSFKTGFQALACVDLGVSGVSVRVMADGCGKLQRRIPFRQSADKTGRG